MWNIISENFPKWAGALADIGADTSLHIGRSRDAVGRKAVFEDSELQHLEQEHWCSSVGLLLILASPQMRKAVTVRKQLFDVGLSFLRVTMRAADLASVGSQSPPVPYLEQCTAVPLNHAGQCFCVQEFLLAHARVLRGTEHEGQAYHLLLLLQVLSKHTCCPGLRAWFLDLLIDIAAYVDDNVEAWGDFSWHKTDQAHLAGTGRKRRRVDPHVRQWAVQDSLQAGEQSNVTNATKSLHHVDSSNGIRWLQEEMAAYRCSTMLGLSKAQQIGIALDGARIGRPAREFLALVACDLATLRHAVLPPQVLIHKTIIQIFLTLPKQHHHENHQNNYTSLCFVFLGGQSCLGGGGSEASCDTVHGVGHGTASVLGGNHNPRLGEFLNQVRTNPRFFGTVICGKTKQWGSPISGVDLFSNSTPTEDLESKLTRFG